MYSGSLKALEEMSIAPAMKIITDPPWLLVTFDSPQSILSWSVNRPGHVESDKVAWLQISDSDLPEKLDPRLYLHTRLAERGLDNKTVTFMTSRNINAREEMSVSIDDLQCRGVATLDLGNGCHVGHPDSRKETMFSGTINMLIHISAPLDQAAMLEGISIVTQGRTAALCEIACTPRSATRPVTGTGTDCIALACPVSATGAGYAGLHTDIGKALGACAYELTKKAATKWMQENGL